MVVVFSSVPHFSPRCHRVCSTSPSSARDRGASSCHHIRVSPFFITRLAPSTFSLSADPMDQPPPPSPPPPRHTPRPASKDSRPPTTLKKRPPNLSPPRRGQGRRREPHARGRPGRFGTRPKLSKLAEAGLPDLTPSPVSSSSVCDPLGEPGVPAIQLHLHLVRGLSMSPESSVSFTLESDSAGASWLTVGCGRRTNRTKILKAEL